MEDVAHAPQAMDATSRDAFIALLNSMPNGVIRNSDVMKGVVETSLNVGVVKIEGSEAKINCLIRSLIDSGKHYVVDMLTALGQLAGAHTLAKGSYPGWQPDGSSPVMALVRETYEQLFNKTPSIQVIHAGLECGLFRNLIRRWIWFLSDRPSPEHIPRMSRYTSPAWACIGNC